MSFLVVSSSITGKFKDFSSEVFHDGGEIYRGSGSNGDVEKYTGASHFVSLAAIRSFLVVSSSVTGKFKDFSSKVLHDSGEVYRGRDLFVFDSWSPVWRR